MKGLIGWLVLMLFILIVIGYLTLSIVISSESLTFSFNWSDLLTGNPLG